jgi:hypothetical protein
MAWGNEQTYMIYMRNYQRMILSVWAACGTSYYYGNNTTAPLWAVTEGDINIQGGRVSW